MVYLLISRPDRNSRGTSCRMPRVPDRVCRSDKRGDEASEEIVKLFYNLSQVGEPFASLNRYLK